MDRFGRRAVAVPCLTLLGAGFLAISLTREPTAFAAAAVLLGIGNGFGAGIVMTLGIDVSPVHGRTRYLSWWNTMLGAGRLSAPLLVTAITLLAPVAVAGAATRSVNPTSARSNWGGRSVQLHPSGRTRSTASATCRIKATEGAPVPSSTVTMKCPGRGSPEVSTPSLSAKRSPCRTEATA